MAYYNTCPLCGSNLDPGERCTCQEERKIIAVDFDGTLCSDQYPEIGAPVYTVINLLKREQSNGARIILWTCRTGERLRESIEWCKNKGIVFDAVNENLKENIKRFKGDTRKIYADEYWDDKNINIKKIKNLFLERKERGK